MKRREFLKAIGTTAAALSLSWFNFQCTSLVKQPNFLFIFTDDQGYGDLSLHGNKYLETPNLDQLAKQSVEFVNFHSSPLCAPSRASLLTGRQFLRTGGWGVHRGHDYMNLDETTFAEVLQQAGYKTAMMGKWHNGHPEAWKPWNRGFDDGWEAHLYSHENCEVNHNGKKLKWEGWTTDRLTDLAIQFMSDNRGNPFFCYLSFLAPHAPWYVAPTYFQKYIDKGLAEPLATCFGMIDQIDFNVGRLMQALDQLGLAENTIVIFTSDNGPINEAEREWGKISEQDFQKRNPLGLRGRKGEIWENGTRVPFFVRWQGQFKPAQVHWNAHLVDLFLTILDLSGVSIPKNNKPLDGKSLKPLLKGRVNNWRDRLIFNPKDEPYWQGKINRDSVLPNKSVIKYENQVLSVRNQRFKLIKEGNRLYLFDISSDPREQRNLVKQHPDVVRRLENELRKWYEEILADDGSYTTPRFLIGDPRDQEGYIYACAAASISGNVQGGSHYTKNWRAPGDAQTVLVKILESGRYDFTLDARVGNPNAKVQISIGDRKVVGQVTKSEKIYIGARYLLEGKAEMEIRIMEAESSQQPVFESLWGVWVRRVDSDQ